jgi:hypothetical protein
VYFPRWLLEVEKDKPFVDVARAWEVPEAQIPTVRRDFDRWRKRQ